MMIGVSGSEEEWFYNTKIGWGFHVGSRQKVHDSDWGEYGGEV